MNSILLIVNSIYFYNVKIVLMLNVLSSTHRQTFLSGDKNIKLRETKRLSKRIPAEQIQSLRTSSRVSIGVNQALNLKTKSDRFGFGIINAHQTKFFYAGIMDGYNGWQMGTNIKSKLINKK